MKDGNLEAEPKLMRKTLSSQLYAILERKVTSGELAPGTRVSEESIAETFQVSRSPAREALFDLERSGFAERVGPRERMITIPRRDTIAAKYELWWIVDIGRTYLASLHATQEDIVELRRYLDRMERAVNARDPKRYRAACEKWHEKLRRGCPNEIVNQAATDCDVFLKWLEVLYDRAPDISDQSIIEHTAILDAFERRSLSALAEAIHPHMTRHCDRILAIFDAARLPGSADNPTPPAAG